MAPRPKSAPLATKTYGSDVNLAESIPTLILPTGWVSIEKLITRGCGRKQKLAVRLLDIARESGLQGVPALEYLGRLLLWHLAGSDIVPIPSSKLKPHEQELIRTRARAACIAELEDTPPFAAPVACERLGLDPYDHRPIGVRS
jgi:hypothetical protein